MTADGGGVAPGQVVLVTGAASGIGRATAAAFLAAGDDVLLTDLDGEGAAATARALDPGGARARGLALDVTAPEAWAAAVDLLRAWRGRLDVLAHVAGVAAAASLAEQDLAGWRRAFAVHVDGPLLGTQACLPLLRAASGSVVHVASASGKRAQAGAAAYCASKAALLMLSRVAARELAPLGVRVNCVVPGGVRTPMWDAQPFFHDLVAETGSVDAAYAALASDTPLGRFCTAEEVAAAIVWLAGASGVAGAELAVDGAYGA